jgi:RimJ/RimL family protein N-acetyltransferase
MISPTISGPAYSIHTQRLVIRCWNPKDAQLLKEAIDANLDHLRPWMPWAHDEPTELQVKIDRMRQWRGKFDLGEDFLYGIFSKDESRVLGGTGLHTRVGPQAREIGYWVHKDFLNQGFATESSAALTRVAFEIDQVQRIEIHCRPDNIRSAAVPRKLGYIHEATLRQRTRDQDDKLHDSMTWSLFAEDYPHSPASKAQIEAYDVVGRRIL